MSGWDAFAARPSIPAWMLAELDALRTALPGYDVIITSHSPTWRFEAIRRGAGGPGPWCVISSDPGDLWWELAGRLRPAAVDRDPAGHALAMARLTINTPPRRGIPPH
jgi:hypothetical protein